MIENNLLYILSACLVFLLLIEYFIFEMDILNPAFIMTGSFAVGSILASLSISRWELTMSFPAVWAILGGVGMFTLANICVAYIGGLKQNTVKANVYVYNTRSSILFGVIVLMALMFAYSLNDLYNTSLMLGNTRGLEGMIPTVRKGVEANIVQLSRWMNYQIMLAQVLASIYSFVFIKRLIYKGFSFDSLNLLLPAVLFMPFTVLTTGRMAIITFFLFIIQITGILYLKKNQFTIRAKMILLGSISVAVIVLATLFIVMGTFAGKYTNSEYTPLAMVSHYWGLSIPALGVKLDRVIIESPYIGSHTLLGVYRILEKFIPSLPEVQIFLPFTQFYHINTNVYTAIGRYIHDFGYIGMGAIMWLLGIFYSSYYWTIKRINSDIALIIYGIISYPVFLSVLDERFFLDLFGTTVIYWICLSIVISKIVFDSSTKELIEDY